MAKHLADPCGSAVFIIGAARSGTKLVRALLSASPEFTCYPYDCNFAWKYGNYHIDHDELSPSDVSDSIARFIQRYFGKLTKSAGRVRLLEKTVSNSLRIDFVRAIFSDCKIIHLFRDGIDVASSARECWLCPPGSSRIQSKRDLIAKVIRFPFLDAGPYLTKAALPRFFSPSHSAKTKTWGPRFRGIDQCLQVHDLLEVCGIQWAQCVQRSLDSLAHLKEAEDYIDIRYEDLVRHPVEEIRRMADFLGLADAQQILDYARRTLDPRFLGSGRKNLSQPEIDKLLPHIQSQRDRLGYGPDAFI